jgi:TonB family protein
MTRLQKKCFLFSAGMHGLLLVILLGSSAFRDKPVAQDMPILTMIPANILDKAGVGGANPEPVTAPQPAPQPAPQAVQPAPPTPKPVAPRQAVEPIARPKPREVEPEPTPKPLIAKEPTPKPVHEHHEIVPEFDHAAPVTHNKTKPKTSETTEAQSSAQSAEARHLKQIARAFDSMANAVKTSGAKATAVDMPGEGGGEAFADYKTVIYNYYYHAWIAPDSVANKLAGTDVKIVVARDGAIISAEIIKSSSEPVLDKSVERALRMVPKLPPFPAASHDEQRSFLIRFNLESKESSE